ncbi:MAG: LysR family transcriptional regulator [Rhizobiaceae bacterium]|nr:LysR family transcriptional regulator [Rhizobiaceae bacterium]
MHLPSIQALRALDGLARLGSMLRASQEMNLTPSAISHQLRSLEADLGQQLVERDGKGVVLTAFGRRYAEQVGKALSLIQQAGAGSEQQELSGGLSISCVPGFAIFWLCNYLEEFRSLYPKINLTISTPHRLDDVHNRGADLFIAFGTGNWPGMKAELLAEIEFAPYCCPRMAQERGGQIRLDDVDDMPLLHMGNYDDWTRWFAACGLVGNAQRGIVFSNMYLVLSATVSGLGIAIGDNLTCRAALRQGQLIRPFEQSIRSIASYYLVSEPDAMERPICKVFRDWLTAKLAELRPEMEGAPA